MEKTILIICVLLLGLQGCSDNLQKWDTMQEMGYAPYKLHIKEGWIQDKTVDYHLFRKRFSADHPMSNFNIQTQQIVKSGDKKHITLEGYTSHFVETIKKENKAEIISVEDFKVGDIDAKKIRDIHPLTLRGITRDIYGETIIFTIHGFVYTFTLGSFEIDYLKASSEFEEMVKSFRFITDKKVIENIDENTGHKTVLK